MVHKGKGEKDLGDPSSATWLGGLRQVTKPLRDPVSLSVNGVRVDSSRGHCEDPTYNTKKRDSWSERGALLNPLAVLTPHPPSSSPVSQLWTILSLRFFAGQAGEKRRMGNVLTRLSGGDHEAKGTNPTTIMSSLWLSAWCGKGTAPMDNCMYNRDWEPPRAEAQLAPHPRYGVIRAAWAPSHS